MLEMATSSSPIMQRFSEPVKFLPVAFIWCNIIGLYAIYMTFHCVPLLKDPATHDSGVIQVTIFHVLTFALVICYMQCILVHPGTIPDPEEDATWKFVPQDTRTPGEVSLAWQEQKRSGDRRHCKWCGKYKPDRCHHCRVCRVCILKMDHHCPWIYNCVGFRNHKFFFLLLFYATMDMHLIVWTMISSVKEATVPETPFMTMFLLLFGESLAVFIGLLLTNFFAFHIYLMFKAMTTIEFCEKSLKRSSYDSSAYDRGPFGNMKAVLGDNVLLWLLPVALPEGDGLTYVTEDMRLTKDMEAGRGVRRKTHQNMRPEFSTFQPLRGGRSDPSGTGSCQDDNEIGAVSDADMPHFRGTG